MSLQTYAQQQIARELPQAQKLANDIVVFAKTQHKNQLCEFIAYKLLAETYRASLPSHLKLSRIGSTANDEPTPNYELLVDMINLEIDSIGQKMNQIAQLRLSKVQEIVGEDKFEEYIKTHSPEEINTLINEGGIKNGNKY